MTPLGVPCGVVSVEEPEDCGVIWKSKWYEAWAQKSASIGLHRGGKLLAIVGDEPERHA